MLKNYGSASASQESSHDELIESLKITLKEALPFNREEALSIAGTHYNLRTAQ